MTDVRCRKPGEKDEAASEVHQGVVRDEDGGDGLGSDSSSAVNEDAESPAAEDTATEADDARADAADETADARADAGQAETSSSTQKEEEKKEEQDSKSTTSSAKTTNKCSKTVMFQRLAKLLIGCLAAVTCGMMYAVYLSTYHERKFWFSTRQVMTVRQYTVFQSVRERKEQAGGDLLLTGSVKGEMTFRANP